MRNHVLIPIVLPPILHSFFTYCQYYTRTAATIDFQAKKFGVAPQSIFFMNRNHKDVY